jgi:ABC transporter substrate binding protein
MAVIISSHKSTVAMMNSIHTLLSENHPCTLFMASLHPGYHAPIEQGTLSHLRQMTEPVPYSYLRQRQDWTNPLPYRYNLEFSEVVRRQVAVIATAAGFTTALAAKGATTTIPIVFSVSEDPVKFGLVPSLARPGGNLTGINLLGLELTAKRLELLREMLPAVARVAVLVNPANTANAQITLREVEAAGRAMGLQLQIFNASTSREIDVAFAAFGRERPDAVFVGQDAFFNGRRSPSRSTANGCIGSLVAFGHRCRPRASCWWRTMRCSASGCADGSRVHNGLYARPRTVARRSNVSKRASRT